MADDFSTLGRTLDPEASPSARTLIPVARKRDAPALAPALAGLVVQEELGSGAVGVVHSAQQALLGRHVAIKRPRKAAGGGGIDALLREARVMGSLEHPNIIPVHGLGADAEGRPTLVMKRVDGVTWESRFDALPRVTSVRYLLVIARTLAFAHTRGFVHRDVKPSNVMLGLQDEAYLMDWGAAAEMDRPCGPGGTPSYMAPEMFELAVGHPSMDVYCLGAILHRLLTGSLRNPGRTLGAARASSNSPYTGPYDDRELGELCRRSTALEPSERPDVDAFVEGLASWLDSRALQPVARDAMDRLERLRECERSAAEVPASLRAECLFALKVLVRDRPNQPAHREDLAEALGICVRDGARRDLPVDLLEEWVQEYGACGGDAGPLQVAVDVSRARQRASEQSAFDQDARVEIVARNWTGITWIGLYQTLAAVGWAVGWWNPFTSAGTAALGVVNFACAVAAIGMHRRAMMRNAVNRGVCWTLVGVLGASIPARFAGHYFERTLGEVQAVDVLLMGAAAIGMSTSTGWLSRLFGLCCLCLAPFVYTVSGIGPAVAFHGALLFALVLCVGRLWSLRHP